MVNEFKSKAGNESRGKLEESGKGKRPYVAPAVVSRETLELVASNCLVTAQIGGSCGTGTS